MSVKEIGANRYAKNTILPKKVQISKKVKKRMLIFATVNWILILLLIALTMMGGVLSLVLLLWRTFRCFGESDEKNSMYPLA